MTTDLAAPTRVQGLSSDAFSSLFQAIGGLRNRRALVAMLGCLAAGVLGAGLLMLGGGFMVLLGALLFLVAAGTGINAAGVLLMDQAKGAAPRGLVDALVYGLLCIPKAIALGLLLLGVALLVFLALALLFLICKIPGLGPVLFVVVFPLSVLVAGLTVTGLFVCMLLALPALWEGAGVMRALAQALAIVRSRLVESLLLLVVVWLLAFMVGLLVFGVLFWGLLPTLGMSASILGAGMGLDSVVGMAAGMGGGGFDGGFGGGRGPRGMRGGGSAGGGLANAASYAIAGGIGGALLWAVCATLIAQVYLLGLNLVYLRVIEGLDVGSTERALSHGLDEARRRTAELSQKAREAAERAREQARQAAASARSAGAAAATAADPAPLPMMPPAPAAPACPTCRAAVGTDDLFCGVCGHKLR